MTEETDKIVAKQHKVIADIKETVQMLDDGLITYDEFLSKIIETSIKAKQ